MPDYSKLTNLRSWQNSGSGIAAFALIAPMEWFVTPDGIKSPVAPFTDLGDAVTIKTAHAFIAGKGFLYFALAPQKNQLDAATVGDVGFNKQNQEATIFVPGNDAALHESFQTLINVPLIALIKDSACKADLYFQLGSDCEGAFLSGAYATGTSKDGVKGYNAKLNYDGPIQFYQVTGGPEVFVPAI